jgi:hypothetical protein
MTARLGLALFVGLFLLVSAGCRHRDCRDAEDTRYRDRDCDR